MERTCPPVGGRPLSTARELPGGRARRARAGRAAVVRDSAVQNSDYALGIWSLENKESANCRVAQVGPREWAVVRMIVTDKVRHVKLDANGRAECECKLYDETEVMCRHIMAVARSGQLG